MTSNIVGCTKAESSDSDIVKILKVVPENTKMGALIYYLDLEELELQEDPDFEHSYDEMLDTSSAAMEGVCVSDISGMAIASAPPGFFCNIQVGKFDPEDIRDNLKEKDYIESEYLGSEIWMDSEEHNAFTFIDNMVIFGSKPTVQTALSINKKKEPSIYDNEDIKSVLDKVPDGINYLISTFSPGRDIKILACGISVRNLTSSDEVVDITGWFKFGNNSDARAALEYIENVVEDLFWGEDINNVDCQVEGNFIKITGDMDAHSAW
jgi:hypothetical protein